ncbi:hypothetical protein D3C79_701960 [compost metagenome]
MRRVTHAVLHRFAKAEPVNSAGAVFIYLGSGRFPACKAALSKTLNHLAQACENRIAFHVSSATPLSQPGIQAYASGVERQTIRPPRNAQGGGQLSRSRCQTEAGCGPLGLAASTGRERFSSETLHSAAYHGCIGAQLGRVAEGRQEGKGRRPEKLGHPSLERV